MGHKRRKGVKKQISKRPARSKVKPPASFKKSVKLFQEFDAEAKTVASANWLKASRLNNEILEKGLKGKKKLEVQTNIANILNQNIISIEKMQINFALRACYINDEKTIKAVHALFKKYLLFWQNPPGKLKNEWRRRQPRLRELLGGRYDLFFKLLNQLEKKQAWLKY
jgi:hypothetical protein